MGNFTMLVKLELFKTVVSRKSFMYNKNRERGCLGVLRVRVEGEEAPRGSSSQGAAFLVYYWVNFSL